MTITNPREIAIAWLSNFEELCALPHTTEPEEFTASMTMVFTPDSWFRDMLALSWDFHSFEGIDAIQEYLTKDERLNRVGLSSFYLDEQAHSGGAIVQPLPRGGDCVLLLFRYNIAVPEATGRGCARLLEQPDGSWKAWNTFLILQDLVGHEEKIGRAPSLDEKTWEEVWEESNVAVKDNLAVLVVGGGQAGLMVAARLKYMGIKALVVERKSHVGAAWTERYDTLKLHTPIHMNSFPYQSYPSTWSKYIPKAKVASFLRNFKEAHDLVVWESTELLSEPSPQYDGETKTWTAHLACDGKVITVHPRHIIVATGIIGAPKKIAVPGLDEFDGVIYHSDSHRDASRWKGKDVIVIGTGNSAADIALDVVRKGAAEVTMIQRGPTAVMSMPTCDTVVHGPMFPEHIPIEECDIIANTIPHRLLVNMLRNGLEARAQEMDRELLDGLKAAGFQFTATPLYELVLTRAGGFLMDHGTLPLIISGRIKLKSGVEIERLDKQEAIFTDGSRVHADVIIAAIGYTGMRDTAHNIFGPSVMDQIHELWDLDAEGELRGVYRPCGHDGLWFMAGGFPDARFLGRLLALQILAREVGVVDTRP